MIALFCIFLLFSPVFRQISTENGLSQVTVNSILKGSDGYMWFGTQDGLNRYDGSSIKVFRHNRRDSTSLCSNYVISLTKDLDGRLMACTGNGISIYNQETENFSTVHARINKCMDVRTCGYDGKGLNYLVEDNEGLSLTDLKGKFKKIASELHLAICPCNKKEIYVWQKNRLFSIDRDFKPACRFTFGEGVRISFILDGGGGNVFVGTSDDGLAIVSLKDNTSRFITTAEGLSSNIVRQLTRDSSGRIWITTANNLNIFDPKDSSIEVIRHNELSSESLSGYSLKSIYSDGDGGIWIGTYYAGVSYYSPLLQRFHNISYISGREGISDRVIRALATDRDGKIWIGTSRSGIFRLNPETRTLDRMSEFGSSGEEALNAIVFHGDGARVLLGKSQSRLQCFYIKGYKAFEFDGVKWVISIGHLAGDEYIASTLEGLFLVNPADGRSVKLDIDSGGHKFTGKVSSITVDSKGEVWLGLKQGLGRFSLEDRTGGFPVLRLNTLIDSLPQVQQVLETKDRFWIASPAGLGCVEKSTGAVNITGTEAGLPSQIVRSIEEDELGRLWLGTEKGLVCYTPSTEEIRIYGRGEGVENSKFNPYAHCKGLDGTLYFGGIKGITCIKPSLVGENNSSPDPVITGITVNGEERLVKSGMVRLRHSERNVDISFHTIDFISGSGTKYEYMLEDVDKTWRVAYGNSKATYTNIPKGKHLFTVRSYNDSGVLCQNPGTLTIQVAPVWYDTLAFKFFCVLLFTAGLCIGLYYLRGRIIRKLNAAKLEEIKKLKDNALNTKINSLRTLHGLLSDKDREFFIKFLGIVDDNIGNEDLSVQMIADRMKMSRSNLHIRVRAITGRTALEIINMCRMDKAIILLEQNKLTISEIAYATGFSSPAYFSTCFKEKYGMTPSEWIKAK